MHASKILRALSEIDWRKLRNYKKSVVAKVEGKKILAVCALYGRKSNNINVMALWVDDEGRRAIFYSLCKDCGDLLLRLYQIDRETVLPRVIEDNEEARSLLHLRISRLLERGFKVDL